LRSKKPTKRFYIIFKRVIDLLLCVFGILILSPVLILIALTIKIDSKGPVLFQQKRVGKNKSHFQIYKFRTMSVDTPKDAPTHLLGNPDSHITKAGRILRRTSLDELPQLLNIIKGEMAIVGPRPALWNQFDLIEERDKYGANDLTPGLTGWAQINGRDELAIADKAKLDGEYVEKIGIWIDIQCLFKTLFKVIKSDGIVEGVANQDRPIDSKETNEEDPSFQK